jgi:hypothetical protein
LASTLFSIPLAAVMARVPFDEDQQLCSKLIVDEITENDGLTTRRIRVRTEQAPPQQAMAATVDPADTLPGDPRIPLKGDHLAKILENELTTTKLNDMQPYYYLMTTKSSKNISSLTEQVVRGRKITITENPGLHLVWVQDRVFLKPLPEYLMSYQFWEHYLLSDTSPIKEEVRKKLLQAARGFLRSYFYLVQHKSDFQLATKDEKAILIPESITYDKFNKFIQACKAKITDDDVSPRWHVGEIRLTRLNIWCQLTRRGIYQTVEWEYMAYFTRFFGPILFVFAIFSLLLSSMSLVLSVRAVLEPSNFSWRVFATVARGFALFTIFLVLCIIVFFVITLAASLLDELMFALKPRDKKNAEGEANGQAPANALPVPAFEHQNNDGGPFAEV